MQVAVLLLYASMAAATDSIAPFVQGDTSTYRQPLWERRDKSNSRVCDAMLCASHSWLCGSQHAHAHVLRRLAHRTSTHPPAQYHAFLERAARLHQDGDLQAAVNEYQQAIELNANSGEAYAGLSKCLHDQGQLEVAEQAMAKATNIHNAGLASWSLF